MNLIQYASKKERVHVEQIIREQPVLKGTDNVTIKTISVRKSLGLTMDVFAPAAVSDEPLPVLVDIHGGGLIAGRKEQNRNFCIRMAQNGYLVFAPDYRLVPETNIFGQISDVLEAFTVIEDRASEFGGDVRNLFVVADSAGAFLASMAVAAMHNPAEMQPVISRLDRRIPHKVQTLRVGAMAFQSGMFYIYKGKVGLLADSYMELFGQNGTVTFDGIIFQNGVPWEAIKDKVWQLYKSSPCLVNKTNFLSFIETIMNFCDDIEGTKLPFVKKINNKEVTHDDKKAC